MLRGDTVKDDTGCPAVFTEERASASQMTVAKVLYTIPSAWNGWSSKRRTLSLYTSQNEGRSHVAEASRYGMPDNLDK